MDQGRLREFLHRFVVDFGATGAAGNVRVRPRADNATAESSRPTNTAMAASRSGQMLPMTCRANASPWSRTKNCQAAWRVRMARARWRRKKAAEAPTAMATWARPGPRADGDTAAGAASS